MANLPSFSYIAYILFSSHSISVSTDVLSSDLKSIDTEKNSDSRGEDDKATDLDGSIKRYLKTFSVV